MRESTNVNTAHCRWKKRRHSSSSSSSATMTADWRRWWWQPHHCLVRRPQPVRRQQPLGSPILHRPSLRFVLLLLLLIITMTPTLVDAFADNLLSRAGCMVELDPSEVVMNHAVVAATASDDLTMAIVVPHHTVHNGQLVLDTFPTTIQLQMLSQHQTSDYQWVMDVVENAANNSEQQSHFVHGRCDHASRIASRNDNLVELYVQGPHTKLIGAWATDHEPVRLTPTLELVQQYSKGGGDQENVVVSVALQLQTRQLLESCDVLLGHATLDDGHGAISLAPSTHQLVVQAERGDNVPAQVDIIAMLPDDVAWDVLVLEVSAGATFAESDNRTACDGRRHATTRQNGDKQPAVTLTIHEEHTILVHAVYHHDQDWYKLPAPLELVWSPPPPPSSKPDGDQNDEARKTIQTERRHAAAQKLHRQQRRVNVHADSHQRPKKQPLDNEDPQTKVDGTIHAIQDGVADQARQERARKELEHHRRHRSTLAREHHHRVDLHEARRRKALPQQRAMNAAAAAAQADAVPDAGPDKVHFVVGSHYYAGIAILLVAPVLVVQCCLWLSSRRHSAKGRRDL